MKNRDEGERQSDGIPALKLVLAAGTETVQLDFPSQGVLNRLLMFDGR